MSKRLLLMIRWRWREEGSKGRRYSNADKWREDRGREGAMLMRGKRR